MPLFLILLGIVLLGVSGCVLPTQSVSGSVPASAAVKFLQQPGVSRAEVIATLGPPTFESKERRVMMYLKTVSRAWVIGVAGPNTFIGGETAGVAFQTGLHIAYDEQGNVIKHGYSKVTAPELETAARDWLHQAK